MSCIPDLPGECEGPPVLGSYLGFVLVSYAVLSLIGLGVALIATRCGHRGARLLALGSVIAPPVTFFAHRMDGNVVTTVLFFIVGPYLVALSLAAAGIILWRSRRLDAPS